MHDYRIAAIGTAVPPFTIEQPLAEKLLTTHYGSVLRPRSREVMSKVLSHPSVRTRHVAVESLPELVSLKDEDPDVRAERFTRWSVQLGGEACRTALGKAGVSPEDVTVLVVNTCTGYVCPGLSTYLVESLNLPRHCRAFDMVGMGCGGSVPNLDMARSLLLDSGGGVALSVAIEVCSATFQMGNDMSLIISNAIFGDGASAAVVWDRPEGLRMVASRMFYDPGCRDDVRYVHRNGQLHNRLSQRLPQIIKERVPPEVVALLQSQGLAVDDVSHWAIHPGGHRMLEAIKESLCLPESHMTASRSVLETCGNMSSPSAMFALARHMEDGIASGDWCCLVGFGAGLSVYTSLLQR